MFFFVNWLSSLEQFWTDFFPYIDNHMTLHHKLSKLSKDEVDQMNFIIEELLNELSGYFDETELDNFNIEFEKLIIARIKQGIHLKSIRIIF